jgi:glutamate racemase
MINAIGTKIYAVAQHVFTESYYFVLKCTHFMVLSEVFENMTLE